MDGLSVVHWSVFVAVIARVNIPTAKILKRLGFSGGWAVVAIIAPVNLIGL